VWLAGFQHSSSQSPVPALSAAVPAVAASGRAPAARLDSVSDLLHPSHLVGPTTPRPIFRSWPAAGIALVAIHAPSRIHSKNIPIHMDPFEKERRIQTLTLGGSPPRAKRSFYGLFRGPGAGSSPGSLPVELSAELPAPKPPPTRSPLGAPLDIRGVAQLIGCSPWTVRQGLIPKGLPFFRSAASGKLIFYTNQVVRWIESKQGGKKK
jgi:hypothetical protein